ncbi:peptide ABC transporter substrate-binding protein [Agaribacterium haliotis]|uniref:peptide ABC transporter substrate-binding protein n=1 Tax=Agaribacterium haliotis TaxID=2013869 RepID=UPI001EFD7D81|nr:peptide ABC transporter substrate-binding protein [Agaribacterium haliotis]
MLMLSACSSDKLTPAEQGINTQTLLIANGDEPRELDPQLSTGSPEHSIHLALYEGLVSKNSKDLSIEPAVAESWEISDDGRIYTFRIRDNARWSNGDAIKASDYVWSWKRSLLPKFGSEWAYLKYYVKGAEAFHKQKNNNFDEVGIKAVDDKTLVITLNEPCNFFLQLLDHYSFFAVHPATILKHGDIDQAISKWTLPENWVGNGPFSLKKWAINDVIVTEKNPHYWNADNVKLNAVHFYPITDKQAEERAFRSGKVHVTYTPQLAIEKIAWYRENQPEALRIDPVYASYYYEFNLTKAPFNDVRVRKAFAMAIDRKLIVERVTKGGETAAWSFIPTDPGGYQPKQYYNYDIKQARALMAEAGYPDGKGFPPVELLYNTNDNHRKVALAIQQMLNTNLGVQVQLLNQEWKVYLNSRKNLEHDIGRAGWIADYLDASNFIEILASDSGQNHTGWKSDIYDSIIAELKKTTDSQQRFKLFEQANKILADEMPVLPVYNYSDVNLVSPAVHGWHGNVMHYHPYNNVYLEATP